MASVLPARGFRQIRPWFSRSSCSISKAAPKHPLRPPPPPNKSSQTGFTLEQSFACSHCPVGRGYTLKLAQHIQRKGGSGSPSTMVKQERQRRSAFKCLL